MQNPKVILSWGLGTESSAILARWCLSWLMERGRSSVVQQHFARPLGELQLFQLAPGFEPEKLTVITAQLGSEHEDTTEHCERWILPLLTVLGIRFLEVAKAGPRVQDGVIVLQLLADHIFTAGQQIWLTVEPRSLAIIKIELASGREATT